MGSVCCCLQAEDFENSNSSLYRNCISRSCFVQNFLRLHDSLFRRGELALSSSTRDQETAPFSSTPLDDNSLVDTFRPPPMPLPYDADPTYFFSQTDGLDSRTRKGSSELNEETEPLRNRGVDGVYESLSHSRKWKCGEGLKERGLKSSVKLSTPKTYTGFSHLYTSSEDEDVCPTCLEEYTTENPKIVAKCSHHFHLSCIYEWMERSNRCPVCCEVMAFDETV